MSELYRLPGRPLPPKMLALLLPPSSLSETPPLDLGNVVLEEDVAALEEVIVVGYGTQKRINLTGAVSQVSSKEFEDRQH